MAIVRWSPFRDLVGIQQEVNRLFDDLMTRRADTGAEGAMWIPAVDVAETEDTVSVKVEVPGVKSVDVAGPGFVNIVLDAASAGELARTIVEAGDGFGGSDAFAGERVNVEGVSPHWFRHAHASHALDNGAPIHVVQATLGHASLATTGRYTHVQPTHTSSTYLRVV